MWDADASKYEQIDGKEKKHERKVSKEEKLSNKIQKEQALGKKSSMFCLNLVLAHVCFMFRLDF